MYMFTYYIFIFFSNYRSTRAHCKYPIEFYKGGRETRKVSVNTGLSAFLL